MDKITKLQELKYDLDRETDFKKAQELVKNYADEARGKKVYFIDIKDTPADKIDEVMSSAFPTKDGEGKKSNPKIKSSGIYSRDGCTYIDDRVYFLDKLKHEITKKIDDVNIQKQLLALEWVIHHNLIEEPFDDNPVPDARKVLRDAFAKDDGFKLGYMANMRMFINDRTDILIPEQVIYDMIDYIFRE